MKKTVILVTSILVSVILIAAVATSIDDFFMPGSQPGQSGNIEHPNKCDNCHGGYDQAVEPAFNWRGSMMAQAARDPLFYACLAIAEQDAPGSGDLCIRCHAPDGWLNGRSTPTDGSALNNNDREGVQCDFCHKLVDPEVLTSHPYDDNYANSTWPADKEYLNKITMIPPQSGNGMYVAHDDNAKRGPFVDAAAKHQMYYSPFHSESDICGTCHDVSSPVFDKDGNVTSDGFGAAATNFNTYNMLPIERTFSEWKNSDYNPANNPAGVYSEAFGGNKNYVSSCQDCHMKDVSGYGANKKNIPYRNDLPLHDMTGGNTFIPDLVAALYPDEVDIAALNAGKERALYMLQNAASMELAVAEKTESYEATVIVTNNTGHKLPSGYPEGRRIWIQLQAYDSNGHIVYESGAYDPETAVLTKEGTKIYEIKLGMAQNVLDATGLTNYEDGSSFHFVLNNKVVKDNRIPPRGFTNEAFDAIGSPVVEYEYADGEFSDATIYSGIPNSAAKVTAILYYQTVSKEYIEFLRDENNTNEAGDVLYQLWSDFGKSAPVVMQKQEVILSGSITLPVAAFSVTPETGEAPLSVQFTNQSTDATSYTWDFGDGTFSSEENPVHIFQNPQTYLVKLTATNESGSNTTDKTISATDPVSQLVITAEVISLERRTDPKGDKTFATATVVVRDEAGESVSGANVFGEFTGETSETVQGTTDAEGLVSFDSRSVKNIKTGWCFAVTDVQKTGYTFGGRQELCEPGLKSASIVQETKKLNVYPNPFREKLFFEFSREEDCHTTIEIFDITGKKITTLFDKNIKSKNLYSVEFEPQNIDPDIIFYRIRFNNEVITGKAMYSR